MLIVVIKLLIAYVQTDKGKTMKCFLACEPYKAHRICMISYYIAAVAVLYPTTASECSE